MRDLPVRGPGVARARSAAASEPHGAAARRPAAEALALRGRVPAGRDAVRGRRARGGRAAALVGRRAAGRDAARGHAAASSVERRARARARRARPRARRGRRRRGRLAARPLATSGRASRRARARCAARARGRARPSSWTATTASSTSPPATTRGTPPGAGPPASAAPTTGARVAWNLVDGVHDAPVASERTVWVDGEPREVPPLAFAGRPLARSASCASASGPPARSTTNLPADAQPLPAAVRRVQRRRSRAVSRWPRATG